MSKITSESGTPDDEEFADWMTASEAAEELGVTDRWIRDLAEAGKLIGRKMGRMWLVRRSSVERYKQQRKE